MSDLTVEQAREKVKLERSRLWLWINTPMEHAEKALDALIAAAEAKGRAEERERCEPLRRFAKTLLDDARLASWMDGAGLQEFGEELGLLIPEHVAAPCAEGCACADAPADEWPVLCYRDDPLLSSPETLAAIDAGIVAAREGRVTPMTFVDHVSPTTEDR